MNCGLALTRLAYFAVGMIEELPPAGSMEELIAKSQLPAAKTIRPRKEGGTSSQRPTRAGAQTREEEKEEESLFEESKEIEESKNIDTDSKEDPFQEHRAQSE